MAKKYKCDICKEIFKCDDLIRIVRRNSMSIYCVECFEKNYKHRIRTGNSMEVKADADSD